MALHGSATANFSPILTKSGNRVRSLNVIIHNDESGSMTPNTLPNFYTNGVFVKEFQDSLLSNKIGTDVEKYPNLYGYFGVYGRDPSLSFTVSNGNGSLTISQAFMRGESTGTSTQSKWTSSQYFSRSSSHIVNICSNIAGSTTGGRLNTDLVINSEDVHGSLWSIYTSPNAISTGTPGRYGSVITHPTRSQSTTVVITGSNDQDMGTPEDMINQLVAVSSGTRAINGSSGELVTRGYKVIALSSYNSTDSYSGVLFYEPTSPQPYGYVTFTSYNTYTITRSANPPTNWTKNVSTSFLNPTTQTHDTLTLATETRGGLFKINRVYAEMIDNRIAFAKCIADFISNTI